ncbi:4-hydroxy-tetrahydrodipicolinate synthase [Clostridium intestinale]|uniref:4-hydroxy-tetrahydrodipicolinate synthase n=1 Tax=Clostridium intestinale TaxID=36845 RepID=UPI0028E7317D|nr:4-hydroxy-tetrahydrodipicolinate synthase [Clostridium intestinale]
MSIFTGAGVALVTPFNESGVNFHKLRELIEWQISEGTDAIIICGTTGEASTMSESEKKDAIKFTVDTVNGRIPVIAGTGTNSTKTSIDMSKWAESIGVDGLLIINPYYNKTSLKGLYHHFKAINDEVSIPIIVYNVPSRTGMNITPKSLEALSELDNIKAVKEASGDISQIAQIASKLKDKIDIYSGNDDQIVPILSLGGKGVISVASNIIPKIIHDICTNYFDGNINASMNLQLEYLELINTLFIETNPIPVKTALNLMNMNVGDLRLPLYEMEDINKNTLINVLLKYKLMK